MHHIGGKEFSQDDTAEGNLAMTLVSVFHLSATEWMRPITSDTRYHDSEQRVNDIRVLMKCSAHRTNPGWFASLILLRAFLLFLLVRLVFIKYLYLALDLYGIVFNIILIQMLTPIYVEIQLGCADRWRPTLKVRDV